MDKALDKDTKVFWDCSKASKDWQIGIIASISKTKTRKMASITGLYRS